jgi:hypothetical protein
MKMFLASSLVGIVAASGTTCADYTGTCLGTIDKAAACAAAECTDDECCTGDCAKQYEKDTGDTTTKKPAERLRRLVEGEDKDKAAADKAAADKAAADKAAADKAAADKAAADKAAAEKDTTKKAELKKCPTDTADSTDSTTKKPERRLADETTAAPAAKCKAAVCTAAECKDFCADKSSGAVQNTCMVAAVAALGGFAVNF